jgi:hypothetical protein
MKIEMATSDKFSFYSFIVILILDNIVRGGMGSLLWHYIIP